MYRSIVSFISVLFVCISLPAFADDSTSAELQGYGAFSNLNKDWMLMALYNLKQAKDSNIQRPQRLEIRIATEKFSQRRFRQLWLETLAVEHGAKKVQEAEAELQNFFSIIQAPLKRSDILVLERTKLGTEVNINYHTLGTLPVGFLDFLVQGLIGKHPPTQALKTGLTGLASLRDQTELSIRFERLEPTLPRISELSRWGRRTLAATE